MNSSIRLPFLLMLTVTLGLSTACATGSSTKPSTLNANIPTEHITLDPMLVKSSRDGSSRSLSADEVFKNAYDAYSNRRYEEAVEHYNTIIKYFGDSRFYLSSLFNSGLALEKLERWDDAATAYKKIIEMFPAKKDAKDAYFRLAAVNEELKDYQATYELMTQVMLRPDVNHFDRIEAHVRRAEALVKLNRLKEAERSFKAVLRLNKDASAQHRLADGARYIVRAQYGLGRAYHLQVSSIPLVLPTEKMGQDLTEKGNLFLKAQAAYIRALRVHNAQWSVAAGYMIGRLYEDFYVDIFSAEIPEGLNKEQLSLYFKELRQQLRPLMVRAIQVYKKNLSLSQRIVIEGDNGDWKDQTSEHLERLESYLNDPFTQRRAERLVLQKRDLKNLWNPHVMAQDTVTEAMEDALQASKKRKRKPPSTLTKPKS